MLTHPDSLILREVLKNELPKKQVETAFLTVLNRRPSENEKKLAFDQLNTHGDSVGISNITWALLTSLEFMFVQ
jgi:hypothetical protein